jgi:glycolate oxidase FAD binding subunit
LPANAVATLAKVSEMSQSEMTEAIATIHASSGLGKLKVSGDTPPKTLLKLRQLCKSQGGFLTVLAAPQGLKQQFDVWGYSGNALEWMQKLKQQFDPQNLLSPHRFIRNS